MEENGQKPTESSLNKWRVISLAAELGFIIALPLVAFAFLGKWLDHKFNSFPWITLGGIALAIVSTTIWLTKRLRTYIK